MIKLISASLKQQFRNKQALFWSIVFPLLFAFIFGMFFGKNTVAGTVGIINKSDSELAKTIVSTFEQNEAFNTKTPESIDQGKDELKKNQLIAVLYIPEKFGQNTPDSPHEVTIISDPGSTQSASIVNGVVDNILSQATLQAQGAKPLFSIKQESSSSRKITYFDFIIAGLIGLSLMNSAVQGMAITIAKYRDEKILKRITTTPLPSWKFILSEVVSKLVLNFIQVSALLAVGIYIFDAHIYGNVLILYLLALLGAVLFLSIGFVVAALSRTTEAAEGMATAITVPMMFLGGVFFPLDSLPKWLYSIVQYIPLAPLLRMLRDVSLEATSPLSDPKNIIIVISWIVVMLLIAIWKFRFSEE